MKLPKMTPVICAYPECSNMVWITVQQKRELKVYNALKYGDSSDICCSLECQQKLLKELSESEFLTKGNVKNRDYALIIDGVDVSKRPKEKEVHLITGTESEQRTKCVVEKLMSMSIRKIKLQREKQILNMRYITPTEIKEFLSIEINPQLRVKDDRLQVTASEIITKSLEMFPHLVSVERIDKKTRVLVSIK